MLALMSSCIKNDIPYPRIQAVFISFKANGIIGEPKIDNKTQTVTLTLQEQTDIRKVDVVDYEITEGASISEDISGKIDLTREKIVTLSLYQDYDWEIIAKQEIERYFSVEGQIGVSVIDVPSKRVVAYVSKSTDMSKIYVSSMKFGPKDVTSYSEVWEGNYVNFSSPRQIKVHYHDTNETWTVFVEKSNVDVSLTQVDAWTRVIWAYGATLQGEKNGLEYRKKGDADWIALPESEIKEMKGGFVACINDVMPATEYEVRAISGEVRSASKMVTTDVEELIPNMHLDDWSINPDNEKVYQPWAAGLAEGFWDTGNKGAATLGQSNSVPTTDTYKPNTGQAAELNTRFVGIASLGKLAAGNLFTGKFVRTDGTNGILNFGQPYTKRPTRLRGWWKHKAANISHYVYEKDKALLGRPDTAAVYIALTDWDKPLEIRTNPQKLQLFDKNDPHVIAYGTIETFTDINSWQEFSIELEYRDTKRVPTHILIVCSCSKLGDYFVGGDGGVLWIDNLSFDWKY